MQTLQELGEAIAKHRRARGLKAKELAEWTGLSPETVSRLERGRLPEFGTRKLMAVLSALGLELNVIPEGQHGTLDELRIERSQPPR